MANNTRRNLRTPNPVIPGRPVDIQIGGDEPAIRDLYKRLGDLQVQSAQIGAIVTPVGGFTVDDVLVFDGANWVAVDKAGLIALNDLTDTVISSPTTGQLLRYNGANWVNAGPAGIISLDDLSDVTLTSPSTGAFLVKTSGDWIDQNFTPAKLGVGTASDPTHRFELLDSVDSSWFNGTNSSLATTSRGWHMSKDKTSATKLAWSWHSDGAPCWEWVLDSDTNNAFNSGFGNADFMLSDYSVAGPVLRVSPEETASGGTGTKFLFGRNVATPRAETGFVTMVSPANGLATLVARQKSSQTASLTEWRDSSDAVLLAVSPAGKVAWGVSPTSYLHLKSGSATANTAPLKFTSGTNLTTPESGAAEYNGTFLFFTRASAREAAVMTAAPGAGQNGQAVVWNNGSGAWEYASFAAPSADIPVILGPSSSTRNVIQPTADIIPLVVKAGLGQTADLTEWQSDTGSVLAKVSATGGFTITAPGSTTVPMTLKTASTPGVSLIQAYDNASHLFFEVGPDGRAVVSPIDGNTTTTTNSLTLKHRSTGTPGAGFGTEFRIQADDATVTDVTQTEILSTWVDATDATRKARLRIRVSDTAARECLRMEASGTAAMLGFFGHTASAQPAAYTPSNVTTDRSWDCNSTSIDELADVLATLVQDLQSIGIVG